MRGRGADLELGFIRVRFGSVTVTVRLEFGCLGLGMAWQKSTNAALVCRPEMTRFGEGHQTVGPLHAHGKK